MSRAATTRPRNPPDRLLTIVHAARTRAKKLRGPRGKYDLDAHLPALRKRFATKRCEATGIGFDLSARAKRKWDSPSIDRIDSAKGYTYDNVRFVLWAVNASLSDWGEDVFELISTAWLAQKARIRCGEC